MSVIINILLLLVVISVLTFIHELGHFIAAKLVKAKVLEFSVGFGPKIYSKKKNETDFSIRALPFGGYVKILGDGDPTESKENRKDKGNLKNKSKPAQMFVMLAGVTMNILLAVGLYTLYLGNNNWQFAIGGEYDDIHPVGAVIVKERVSDIPYMLAEDGGAKDSGMYEEGYIISVNGEEILDYDELTNVLSSLKGKTASVHACDMDNNCNTFEVLISKDGKLGVYTGYNYNSYLDYSKNKLFSGFSHSINVVKLTGEALSSLISDAKKTGDYSELSNAVSGPVGIYFIVDYFKTLGLISFLGILADLSLSLALVNVLPVPALDGGRFFILLIESILKKDLDEKVEAAIINISFIFLILFIILIMVKDIVNINELKSLFK